MSRHLSAEQLQAFEDDGVLVVDNVLSKGELEESLAGLRRTLLQHEVDTRQLPETGMGLCKLSSTNGSGGVIDIFYEKWQLAVASNPKLFAITTELWEASYCNDGEALEEVQPYEQHKWHPYGAFDCTKGYMYLDRIGYRIPSILAQQLGAETEQNPGKKKKKKPHSIQRSLTPHLDCCPERYLSGNGSSKWRPIQCFVSLTDNLKPNTGGFEAARGFHREFDSWTKTRPPPPVTNPSKDRHSPGSFPTLCVGEYTHIRPVEDRDVLSRIQHVPVSAGSAVFWDNRIPHANSYRHNGNSPRTVVYCSFLPDVQLNRQYAKQQLLRWKDCKQPHDQWQAANKTMKHRLPSLESADLTALAQKLLLVEPW